MKLRTRLKIIANSTITKAILSTTIVLILLFILIVPSFITSRPKGSIVAFSRDATSGTREAFVEKVLDEDPKTFSPGKNVREAKNNESMIKATKKNKNAVSYVSFGTVAKFDETTGDAIKKEGMANVDFASYNGVLPNKNHIEDYGPSRNFNMFFRVKKGSHESDILKYYDNETTPNDVSDLSDSLKISYLFMEWVLHSKSSLELMEGDSLIPFENDRVDFTKEKVSKYLEYVHVDTSKVINIEIVGSSSASESITDLFSAFENEFESAFAGSNIEDTLSTNGSSDAFKEVIPGATEAYIGLQSREAKTSEFEKWGWTDADKEIYSPFIIDALLIIFNNAGLIYESKLNIETKDIKKLYKEDEYMKYDELFSNWGEVIK